MSNRMAPRFSNEELPKVGARVAWRWNAYWAGVVVECRHWSVEDVHVVDVYVRMRSTLGRAIIRAFDPTELTPCRRGGGV